MGTSFEAGGALLWKGLGICWKRELLAIENFQEKLKIESLRGPGKRQPIDLRDDELAKRFQLRILFEYYRCCCQKGFVRTERTTERFR